MNINIKATKFDLTDAIRDYIQNKVSMLEKFLGDLPVINCDFEVEKIGSSNKGDVFRAEINIQIPKELLRVEKSASDLYKAIDKVKDHMEEIVVETKKKLQGRR